MKKKTLPLSSLLAVTILSAMLIQSCSKKSGGDDPVPPPVDPGPVETATMKFIPDSIFRVYLKANVCPNAFDRTGKLIDITNSEVKNFAGTMKIDSFTCPRPFVSSLKGIEYFSKMTKLIVQNSAIDSLNLKSTMALDTVRILNDKDLQFVDLSGCVNMRYIRVADIPAVSLNFSNLPALNYINLVSLGRLNDLRTDNAANLRHLMTVGLTSLKSVNVSTNAELRRLYFEVGSAINSIDVTKNRKLYGLVSTFSPALKTIDFSKNDSLLFVNLDDSSIDTVDFSHNPELVAVAMLRTPLRNLSFLSNPKLKLLYLDGCGFLKSVDLRAQTGFDYYTIDHQKFNMSLDDMYEKVQHGYVSLEPTPVYTFFIKATRNGVNGATADIFGGLRLPIYLDASFLSLTNVKVNEAIKDNYSLVMSRRVLPSQTPALITTYAADKTTIICNDYDPKLFKCN